MRHRLLRLAIFSLGLLNMGSGCGNDAQPRTEVKVPSADGMRKVDLFLNWYPEVEHGGFYEALVKGYYRDAGLDVTIVRGGPGKPVSPQIDQNRYLFGVENADKLLLQRAQQAEVVAVMAPLRKSPRCIMVHEKSGISSLNDLKDMTLAMRAEDPFAKFLRKRVPLEDVEIVAYSGGIKGFLARDDYGQQGYVFSEPIQAAREGAKPKSLLVADLGFNPYGSVLLTHANTIKIEPDLVRAFTTASIRGWASYLKNPQEANKLIAKENPEMDRELLDRGAEAIREFCVPESGENQLGAMTLERWTELRDQLAEIGMIDASEVDPASAFAPEFAAPIDNSSKP